MHLRCELMFVFQAQNLVMAGCDGFFPLIGLPPILFLGPMGATL